MHQVDLLHLTVNITKRLRACLARVRARVGRPAKRLGINFRDGTTAAKLCFNCIKMWLRHAVQSVCGYAAGMREIGCTLDCAFQTYEPPRGLEGQDSQASLRPPSPCLPVSQSPFHQFRTGTFRRDLIGCQDGGPSPSPSRESRLPYLNLKDIRYPCTDTVLRKPRLQDF